MLQPFSANPTFHDKGVFTNQKIRGHVLILTAPAELNAFAAKEFSSTVRIRSARLFDTKPRRYQTTFRGLTPIEVIPLSEFS